MKELILVSETSEVYACSSICLFSHLLISHDFTYSAHPRPIDIRTTHNHTQDLILRSFAKVRAPVQKMPEGLHPAASPEDLVRPAHNEDDNGLDTEFLFCCVCGLEEAPQSPTTRWICQRSQRQPPQCLELPSLTPIDVHSL